MLVTVSLTWAVLQTGWFLLSPLLPTVIEKLQITKVAADIVLALSQSVYTITQYPGGEYSNRWTRTTLTVPRLSILVLSSLTFGLVGDLVGPVTAVVITGLGKGPFAIPSQALLSGLFVERRGRVPGLYAAGIDLGSLVSSGLTILALIYATWWTLLLPVAVALAGLTVLYMLWSRDDYAVGSPKLHVSGMLRRLFAGAEQRRTFLAFGLSYFVVGGFISLFSIYLIEAKGFDQRLAGATFVIASVVSTAIKPAAGGPSSRFQRESTTVVEVLVVVGVPAVLPVVEARPLIYVSVIALTASYKTEFPLADVIIMDNAPDVDRGADLGAARALFLGVNVLGLAYAGIVATYANYIATFVRLAVYLIVSAGLLYWDACKR